jgi:hypothetical protein
MATGIGLRWLLNPKSPHSVYIESHPETVQLMFYVIYVEVIQTAARRRSLNSKPRGLW